MYEEVLKKKPSLGLDIYNELQRLQMESFPYRTGNYVFVIQPRKIKFSIIKY